MEPANKLRGIAARSNFQCHFPYYCQDCNPLYLLGSYSYFRLCPMKTVLLGSYNDFFDSPGEIPSMFKRAGYHVTIYCCETSWLKSNVFHDEWIDASKDKKAFADGFISLARAVGERFGKAMLLDDETIKIVNEHLPVGDLDIFQKAMPILNIANREMLSSKIGMSNVFARNGIATPRYLNLSDVSATNEIPKLVDFPVLLKVDFSFSGIGIRKCEAPSQLDEMLAELHDRTNVVVQEFIEGEDIGVEALFHQGKLITYQAARVVKYMLNKFSYTTKRIYFRSERIERLLMEMGEKLGMNCFASIGYIYHKERDIYYLIEVDARTNSWMPYSRFTDHDFSEGLKSIAQGSMAKCPAKETGKEYKIILFDRDFRRCFKMKDYQGIWRWATNHQGRWKFIPIYDKVLFGRIMKKMMSDFFNTH